MKKSILSLLLACFLQINLAFAQNVMKGVVSDANGPLVGVVIHDKDNAKGTTSDMSGKYALNGAESGHTIEFRYLGYVTETVQVAVTNTIVCIGKCGCIFTFLQLNVFLEVIACLRIVFPVESDIP